MSAPLNDYARYSTFSKVSTCRRLDLSLLSEQIAACEGLGPLPPGVGSTLRVLLLGPFSSPSDDIDNRLVLECHVVEVSEVEKRIVWDTHVLPSQEKFLGGCAGRRDFITVLGSHEKAPKGSPPPVCEVVWCCEVRKGVDAPPVPDSFLKLGIMSRLIAAFTSDVSPVRYLFPPQVASDAEIGSATSDDLPPGFARVILPSVNEPTPRPIASLSIGDVCVIRSGEVFAADMILLASTSPSETPVSYTNIDGSEALRLRKVKPELDNALAKLIPTPPSAGSTAASAEGEVLVAEPTPDDFANGVLCPVCTFRNDLFQPACEVCGTPLPAFGASTSSEAKTISRKAFLDVVGCGAEGVAAVAAFAGVSFTVTPSRIDGRMKAWFRFPGVDSIRLGSQQFLPGVYVSLS